MEVNATAIHREPWSKGKIVGQKAPLKLKDIWALRVRLQMANRVPELALFDLCIDSKLGGCDLVKLRVRAICHGDQVASRAIVMQQETQRPVQFEITRPTRHAVQTWIKQAGLRSDLSAARAIDCVVGCAGVRVVNLGGEPGGLPARDFAPLGVGLVVSDRRAPGASKAPRAV